MRNRKHYLLTAPPGVPLHNHAINIITGHLEEGYNVIYITNNKSSTATRWLLKSKNIDMDGFERKGKLRIVSIDHGQLKPTNASQKYQRHSMLKLMEVSTDETVVIIDSICSMYNAMPEDEVLSCMQQLLREANRRETTTVSLLCRWGLEGKLLESLKDEFDDIIDIQDEAAA